MVDQNEVQHPRLAIVAPKLFVSGKTGGGERYASEFISAMVRRDEYSIRVFTGETWGRFAEHDPRKLSTSSPISSPALSRAIGASNITQLFQLDSHIADITLASSLLSRNKVVLTDLGGGWRAPGRLLGTSRYRLIAGCAAISKTSLLDLAWPSARPNTVIYGGGDHLRPHGGGRSDEFDFVYVGRLVEHKGVELLIRSLPAGARCLVAGAPMDGGYLETLRDAEAASSADVTFLIGPSDSQIVDAYSRSRWSVSPTLSHVSGKQLRRPELLGLSPLESIALGTPAILSDIPAYAEIAELVGMPKFQAGSSESLKEVLQTSLSKQPDVKSARQMLSWDGTAERTARFYSAL